MLRVWNNLWWGGDPDLSDDVTGLSKRDLHNIACSWGVMYSNQEKYGMMIFVKLFRLNPVTKTFFKRIQNLNEEQIKTSFQFKAHVINLMTALNSAVTNLHQPQVVVALMNKLGDSHHKHSVQEEHFDEVKTVIVDILQNELNEADSVVAAWARFVDFIYKHIFDTLSSSQ